MNLNDDCLIILAPLNLMIFFTSTIDVFIKNVHCRLLLTKLNVPVDLDHLRAVKNDRHQKLASDNSMSSHFISARTDDQVVKRDIMQQVY